MGDILGAGGGGAPQILQREAGPEWQTIKKTYGGQINQANQYVAQDPLLSKAYPFATEQLGDVPGLRKPLEALLGKVPGQFEGYQGQLTGLDRILAGLDPNLAGLVSSQEGLYKDLMPTLETQGALNPEQRAQVLRDTRAGFAARGNATGNQALGGELLDLDKFRRVRYNEALQNALGLSGSIGQLTGERAGITGARAGITGQEAGLTGAEAATTGGLVGGIQEVGSTALRNLLGTSRAGVQNFSQLTNPILGYLQDLFSSNQNAEAAQNIAGANKSSGTAGGILSSVGSIVGGVAAAY